MLRYTDDFLLRTIAFLNKIVSMQITFTLLLNSLLIQMQKKQMLFLHITANKNAEDDLLKNCNTYGRI